MKVIAAIVGLLVTATVGIVFISFVIGILVIIVSALPEGF